MLGLVPADEKDRVVLGARPVECQFERSCDGHMAHVEWRGLTGELRLRRLREDSNQQPVAAFVIGKVTLGHALVCDELIVDPDVGQAAPGIRQDMGTGQDEIVTDSKPVAGGVASRILDSHDVKSEQRRVVERRGSDFGARRRSAD